MLITLVGEFDLESAHLVRASLEWCLRDGIRIVDVDLTLATFCDRCGLNAFLDAVQQTTVAGGTLRPHHPPPVLARIVRLADCGFLFVGSQLVPLPPSAGDTWAAPYPAPPHRSVPPVPVLSSDVR
ncbi:STAS domain-containing protein [Streptomyces sp. NPDC050523]|uniref:STAS domain-containing protein n=1 Tax=Streptomyces sp. NPDC050523 TaxID=3365622 RepID=UPI00378D6A05